MTKKKKFLVTKNYRAEVFEEWIITAQSLKEAQEYASLYGALTSVGKRKTQRIDFTESMDSSAKEVK